MTDGKVRLPRDVASHINKKRTIRVAAFAAIELTLITLFVFVIYDYVAVSRAPAFSLMLYALLMFLPIRLLKIPFWLFDKTWAGEIIGKEEEDYLSVDRSLGRRGGIITNKKQHFKIRLDSGKIIEYTVYDDRARHAFRNRTYNIGDRVIHVAGANYLQAVAVGEDDTLICVLCGAESRAEMPMCPVCGKSLRID